MRCAAILPNRGRKRKRQGAHNRQEENSSMDDAKDGAPQPQLQLQPQTPARELCQAHDGPQTLAVGAAPDTPPDEQADPLTLTSAPDVVGSAEALNRALKPLQVKANTPTSAAAPVVAPLLPPSPEAAPFPTTFGPYVLLRRLGAGALGEVYLAAPRRAEAAQARTAPPTQRTLDSLVAIKILYAPADDPAAQEVARRTTQAASLVKAHAIPLYELITTGNRLGVVMGFAPRGSLGDALNRRDEGQLTAPLRARVVARLVAQLGVALAALHAGGLAHGDLTPNNIFVHRGADGGPNVALADMGQGALAPEVAQALTQEAPQTDELRAWAALQRRFAAPERATTGAATGATPAGDQYALAMLAYLLLTGRAPEAATYTDQTSISFSPPHPALTPEVDAILKCALSPQPDARYPTIEAFTRALTTALDPTLATPLVAPEVAPTETPEAPAIQPPAQAPTRGAPIPTPPANLRRPLILATTLALIIALCIVSVGVYAFSGVGVYHPPASVTLGTASGPTVTPTPTLTPGEQFASAAAARLLQQTPVFSDPLNGSAKTWATSAGVFYAADGSLHLATSSVAPLVVDDPSNTTQSEPLVQVTLSFVKGNASSLAGVRFFISQNADKTYSFMAYLIAPYGHYSLWLNEHGVWTVLISGYTAALNKGIGHTNTIAALADGPDGVITLFANGQVIAQVYLPSDYTGPTGGTLGLIVLSKNVEAAYTRYAVYAGAVPTATPTP